VNATSADGHSIPSTDPSSSNRSGANELQSRLAGYGISALAVTGALVVGATPASAQIVETTLATPLTIFPSEYPEGILLDFNTMTAHYAIGFTGPGQFALLDRSVTGEGPGLTLAAAVLPSTGLVLDTGPFAFKYAKGSLIPQVFSSAKPIGYLFFQGSGFAEGSFAPGSTTNRGFAGLAFHLGSTNPTTFFGWADIGVDSDSGLTLYAFGYNATNSTGGPFADPVPAGAGEAPEPSPLALLLLGGAAGMAAYRADAARRGKKRAATLTA
jgi:hypothetical protein